MVKHGGGGIVVCVAWSPYLVGVGLGLDSEVLLQVQLLLYALVLLSDHQGDCRQEDDQEEFQLLLRAPAAAHLC